MTEYIKREAALLSLTPIVKRAAERNRNIRSAVNQCVDAINFVPAADVRPVVRGKWTLNKDGSGTCSECGRTQKNCWDLDNWDNFCHFCGADMREKS